MFSVKPENDRIHYGIMIVVVYPSGTLHDTLWSVDYQSPPMYYIVKG